MKSKKDISDDRAESAEPENNDAESQKDFTAASFESSFETSFFYTNDKFISKLDNAEIFSALQEKYNKLDDANDDSTVKKQIVMLLDDNEFISSILSFYSITVYDLFKVLYNKFASLFKGPFLKKVKATIDGKSYMSATRKKHDY